VYTNVNEEDTVLQITLVGIERSSQAVKGHRDSYSKVAITLVETANIGSTEGTFSLQVSYKSDNMERDLSG